MWLDRLSACCESKNVSLSDSLLVIDSKRQNKEITTATPEMKFFLAMIISNSFTFPALCAGRFLAQEHDEELYKWPEELLCNCQIG